MTGDQTIIYRVRVTRTDTGEAFTGTMPDDGLQSLYAIACDDGETRYATALDRIERIEAER